MAAKIDKEVLIKYHFWILAGCFLILVLVPLVSMGTGVSEAVEKEKKDLEAKQGTLKKISNPKNEKWVAAYEKQDSYVDKKKKELWKQAWDTQADMMTWPVNLEAKFGPRYKYMGDDIDHYDADAFAEEYNTQVRDVLLTVQPVLTNGEGVVQPRGGSWDGLLQLTHELKGQGPVTTEDIWLAQEDLWVKRELLRIVRDANDSVAIFREVVPQAAAAKEKPRAAAAEGAQAADKSAETKARPAPKPAPTPSSDPNHKVFRNPFWELDLTLTRNDKGKFALRGTIKNIGHRRQNLGIVFKVFLEKEQTGAETPFTLLPVDREPLPAGQTATIPETPVPDTVTVQGLYGVAQVLNWKTGVVKRLDDLRLDYFSSRTAGRELKKPRWIKDAQQAADAGGTGTSGGTPSNALMGPTMGMAAKGSGMPGGAAAGTSGATTRYGFVIDRYTDTNEQVRHMPIGMSVVIEEDQIPDFLAAFANSRLRMQTLQVHWHHIRDKIQPQSKDEEEKPEARPSENRVTAQSGPSLTAPTTPTPGATGALGGLGGLGGKGRRGGAGSMTAPQIRGGPAGSALSAMRPAMGLTSGGMGRKGGSALGGMSGMSGMGTSLMGSMRNMGQVGLTAQNLLTSSSEGEEAEEMNLVELSVYGLASLYERYPPKPGSPAAADSGDSTK